MTKAIKLKMLGALALMLCSSVTVVAQDALSDNNNAAHQQSSIGYEMRFKQDGTFKILHITDLHYQLGNEKTVRSIPAVEALVSLEHPDLIVVTGDIIDPPVEESLRCILEPFEAAGVPYALTYGNHDGGADNRATMACVAASEPNCVNRHFAHEPGGGTGLITLLSHDGAQVCRAIYLLDSNGKSSNARIGSFDHVRPGNITWYRSVSNMLAEANGGAPVPALMFYHIPIPELKTAVKEGEICGTRTWNEVTPMVSNGLFLAALEQGDVDGMFFGHDHGNDYSVMWHDILLAYGRYTGCVERIAGLQPQGARVIVLKEGAKDFQTYIRLVDGTIEQDVSLAQSAE